MAFPGMSASRSLILAALACACAAAVPAATKPSATSAAPAVPYATRDQLRECLDMEDDLRKRHDEIDKWNAAHAAALAEVEAQGAKIDAAQAGLDHSSQTAITAYNQLIADYNARNKALRAEADAFQATTDAYNDASLASNRKCSNNVYSLSDMDAVAKERKAAAK